MHLFSKGSDYEFVDMGKVVPLVRKKEIKFPYEKEPKKKTTTTTIGAYCYLAVILY